MEKNNKALRTCTLTDFLTLSIIVDWDEDLQIEPKITINICKYF